MSAARSSTESSSTSGASAQCRVQMKAEAVQDISQYGISLNCGDFNSYQCERRIFAPDVASMTHSLKECFGSGESCVDMTVHQFSTADARERGEDAALFAPGASYNREEVRCVHRFAYKGVSVFEGESDHLEEALAHAMAACESGGQAL